MKLGASFRFPLLYILSSATLLLQHCSPLDSSGGWIQLQHGSDVLQWVLLHCSASVALPAKAKQRSCILALNETFGTDQQSSRYE